MVQALKSDDCDAFAEIFYLEFKNIKFFAHQYLNDLDLAEDVAQESFLALWTHRATLAENSNIKALLLTIAKNKSLNLLRSLAHFQKDSLKKAEILLNMKALDSSHIESQIDASVLAKVITEVHSRLPEHIRATFDLSRLKNKTYKEIATIKGITQKSVEYHIAVALERFRKKLAQFGGIK